MKKSLMAALATISLTAVSLVSGVAPANATYNIDDSIRDISVQRTGAPVIDGSNIVASTTVYANEVLASFAFSADYAGPGMGQSLVIASGQELSSVINLTNTTSGQTVSGYDESPTIRWTKTDDTTGTYYPGNGATPFGTFTRFEVASGKYVNSSAAGNYTASASFKVAGTAVTPRVLVTNPMYERPGFRVRWVGGLSYTPNALDAEYNSYSQACFWPGDHAITSSTVLHVSYDNQDQEHNQGFADNNYSYFSGSDGTQSGYWNPDEIETNEVWSTSLSSLVLLPGIDAVSIRGNGSVPSPTAHAIRPVFKAWLDNNTSVNVLDSCNRYESFAAPTLAPATSTTATLSWVAPTTAHAEDWNDIGVYACLATNTSCGTSYVNPWDMGPNSEMTYDFEFMNMGGPISGTQVTINAMSMMDAAMMMGPISGPPRTWNTTDSYKYFVVYRNMSMGNGYVGLSLASAATTAGGVESTPSTPSNEDASATVVRSKPVLNGFAGHSVAPGVAGSSPRTFELDASGLTGTPEVLINGKKLTYVKDAKGMLTIELPKTLKRGGSYDLVVSSPEGTVTVLGAIVVSADLPVTKNTPTAFRGTSTALSAAQVRNIRALVNASQVGDTVTCTAYVSGATTDAIAKARATNACAAATAVNPELKTVIRTAPAIFSVRNKVRVVIG